MKHTYTTADAFELASTILDISPDYFGIEYLKRIATNIYTAFEFKYVLIGYAIKPEQTKIQTVVVLIDGELSDNFIYDLKGTPCHNVFTGKRVCIHADGVAQQFPEDKMLVDMGVESYIGAPTIIGKNLQGLVAMLDPEKVEDEVFYSSLLEFVSARAAVELERYTHQHHVESLKKQTQLDPLTGCLNKKAFGEALTDSFFEYDSSTVMFIDADHFKQVNDTKGHQYGDKVLIALASTIQESIRAGDMVCRYGGEEFVVYLPNSTIDSAVEIANRIHDSLRNNSDLNITVSIGLTACNKEQEISDAINIADKAVYKAKHCGRNRTEVL
ncbi:sensor domain-containing diguanylate cyclase [Pleionea sp. CnH1-48]|uniref:sensor domain-containing diguanylate cyclase n=1 Tax=Pleionea sp. CnH1-48 TaxID=2954494 RepID=UPI0020978B76|nr:sensor domain-containing diguanylate cyclase [Pleionea sp. CnH1-48]MCO7224804.1 sensor domain-containing diguanylate cyclase [Pleionea sp. CnH1-48]